MTKEEIVAIVRECTATLGHAPTVAEIHEMGRVTRRQVRKTFGTHTRMLAESGVMREGSGYPLTMRSLFLDWAQVVRSLGKAPSVSDYMRLGKYSYRSLSSRFGGWCEVPSGMLEYVRKEGLKEEWQDVMDIIVHHEQLAAKRARMSGSTSGSTYNTTSRPRPQDDQPDYGQPLPHSPLSYAPTNEAGVVLLFGSMARELGFVVMRMQAAFPDCEALREVGPNRWQRVRIEFEYESRGFLLHMHPAAECDLIVCWSHNWLDCPLEVLELRNRVTTPADAKAASSGDPG